MSSTTATIEIATEDGTADAIVVHPDDGPPHPPVLLYMDAIGLRDRLVEMAERIASQGYYVLVPNVFYRSGRAPLVEDLPDLLKPENRPKMMETLGPFMKRLLPEARTAAAFPERVASVASFHGGNLATEASDSPHLGLGQVRVEVYVAHADNDGSMPPEQMQRLEDALQAAGLRHRTEL